ncbi:MAG: hypothetical protein ACRD8W_24720 [Nitrososphaeraceae archaeon]
MNKSIFLGLAAIGLLAVMITSSVMTAANASIENNTSDPNSNGTNDPGVIEPGQAYIIFDQATRHINEAQAAMQNGDTEGANNHLELAKQSLGQAVPYEQDPLGPGRTDEIPIPTN